MEISIAKTDVDIAACYSVMSELRPHLAEGNFIPQVRHLGNNGCRQVRLVSNVRRVDAHRFYLQKGMSLEAHYFSINVRQ